MLVIAFKGAHNTSFMLGSLFENDKLFLTNSFKGIDKDINNLDLNKYEKIVMFGIDKNLIDKIRIENKAKYNDVILKTNIDVKNLHKIFQKEKIDSYIAKGITNYLCNYAYYKVLEKNKNTIFIHIPSFKNKNEELMNKIKEIIIKAL